MNERGEVALVVAVVVLSLIALFGVARQPMCERAQESVDHLMNGK